LKPLKPLKPLLLLLLLFIGWSAWYAYEKGFGRRWRTTLVREFKRFGLVINVHKLTLDPLHGLIATDVQIFDNESRQTMVAEINQIALDINYTNLLQHEPALNAVDLKDARILIPLNPNQPNANRAEIKHFSAHLYFLPGRIEIHQATGNFYGILLNARGTLLHPTQFSHPQNLRKNHQTANNDFLIGAIDEIKKWRYNTTKPHIDLAFQGDLNEPTSIRIQSGIFVAPVLYRNQYPMHDLELTFTLQNERLIVEHLHVADDHGEGFASGAWDIHSGKKIFRVKSSLNIAQLLGTDPRCLWAADWTFEHPPQIEMNGEIRRNGSVKYLGKLAFDQFTYRSVPFQSLSADFSRDGSYWMIMNGNATHRTGTLSIDAMKHQNDFRARIHSALNPGALATLFPPTIQNLLSFCEFETPPVLQMNLSDRSSKMKDLEGNGRIWLGNTRIRGTAFNSASGSFSIHLNQVHLENTQLHFDSLQLTSKGHTLTLDGNVDLLTQSLDLKSVDDKTRYRVRGSIDHPEWQMNQ
jgi:hypothetical protein